IEQRTEARAGRIDRQHVGFAPGPLEETRGQANEHRTVHIVEDRVGVDDRGQPAAAHPLGLDVARGGLRTVVRVQVHRRRVVDGGHRHRSAGHVAVARSVGDDDLEQAGGRDRALVLCRELQVAQHGVAGFIRRIRSLQHDLQRRVDRARTGHGADQQAVEDRIAIPQYVVADDVDAAQRSRGVATQAEQVAAHAAGGQTEGDVECLRGQRVEIGDARKPEPNGCGALHVDRVVGAQIERGAVAQWSDLQPANEDVADIVGEAAPADHCAPVAEGDRGFSLVAHRSLVDDDLAAQRSPVWRELARDDGVAAAILQVAHPAQDELARSAHGQRCISLAGSRRRVGKEAAAHRDALAVVELDLDLGAEGRAIG
ncbi:MAG: hypothetical protein ACK559_23520, partial [bacterium]